MQNHKFEEYITRFKHYYLSKICYTHLYPKLIISTKTKTTITKTKANGHICTGNSSNGARINFPNARPIYSSGSKQNFVIVTAIA